ncbi:hypothetical protein SAMN05444392_11618 [Seinonella peptonophila]|uniref:Uncharacterized protein n=1 Tax=Seinonella peptonophila TaxID=112248 RepID=A0A1M5AVV2_9BACL|nr:hypothetical protein [Seinonella peptonophila]SHF34052.1 hypothetical protein SAMN05444392_11618 [Seinonella peptonophila]
MDFQVIAHSFEIGRAKIQKSLRGDLIYSRKKYPEMKIKILEQLQGKVENRSLREPRFLPFEITNLFYNTPNDDGCSNKPIIQLTSNTRWS